MQHIATVETEKPVESGSTPKPIEVKVRQFPNVRPKFDKQAWASGEGSGEGEG